MATTPLKYLNQYFTTTLNVGGGIDNSQTTGIVIQAVSGLDIAKPGVACLTYADPINTSTAEWITYTSIDGSNELQGVTRGAEGFGAKTHSNGAVVAFPLSESHINNLNAMFDTTGLDIAQIATPANPSSGRNKLYFKSDGKAYTLSSAGVETQVSPESGWYPAEETWVYASADDPTFTFTIAGVDLTTKYSAGMRIKLTQTTVKYFIITAVAFSTDTTITVYGGTDYDLANAAITSPYYSTQKAPHGFPLDPVKWTVEVTDTTERSKTTGISNDTWYNLNAALTISIPIGMWKVQILAMCRADFASGSSNIKSTFSTTTNSESDADMTTYFVSSGTITGATLFREKVISLAAKTSYYLNNSVSTGVTVNAIYVSGNTSKTIFRAICAYL